jgi:3D (Asp-Asp-Asp) domain-containing protein
MLKFIPKQKKHLFQSIELAMIGLMVIFGSYVFSPRSAAAFSLDFLSPTNLDGQELFLTNEALANGYRSYGQLPASSDDEPVRTFYKIPMTAYSSEVGQTDSTPFITASGSTVRRGVVAANFLPIGTRVRFPDLYGDEVFIVEDRMNARYDKRVDIWMEETADARNFGIQWTTVEVF